MSAAKVTFVLGVGEWYCDFSPVSDEQVLAALGELSDVAA